MVNNSCIYECTIMHNRKGLVENKFYYSYFMFYLDLDEIDELSKKLKLFSHNKFNIYNFRDRDHIEFGKRNTRENILEYLKTNNIAEQVGRIMLLTNVATFGYNFNPVSFYYCFDKEGNPLCVVPEVGNTFNELKPYYLGNDKLYKGSFMAKMAKDFYVSPFINHDVLFDFNLWVPDNKLNIKIDDYKSEQRVFITQLSGKQKALTDAALLIYTLKYPLVTVKVILAIHWQALKLIVKKMHYFKKEEYPELQKGAYVKWKKQ